jgi:hypothetical protein
MKKTLKLALGVVLTVGLMAPTFAQDQFPDVPDHHWAYDALARMKREGLLVGYPDGLFRGGRPASRYELAVAVHATYDRLRGLVDGLQKQIDELRGRPGTDVDVSEIRAQLKALSDEVARMRAWQQEIETLRKLATTFEKELAALGVDVEAMRRDLADLDRRVTALEERRLPVDIHGDANIVALGGFGGNSGGLPTYGLTVDGRPTGVGRFGMDPRTGMTPGYNNGVVGADRDLSIFHEAALDLTSANPEGPQWRATLVFGNMMGSMMQNVPGFNPAGNAGPFFNQGQPVPGRAFVEGPQDLYIQNLSVRFATSLVGQAVAAEIGRTGYRVSPYTFWRQDTTPYYANERWDDGRWMFDGAIIGLNFGAMKLNVFGGRTGNLRTVNGVEVQPMLAGTFNRTAFNYVPITGTGQGPGRPVGNDGLAFPIDQMLGLHLNVPLTARGSVDLTYILLDSNTILGNNINAPTVTTGTGAAQVVNRANRVAVYGLEGRFNFGALEVWGGAAKSDIMYNASRAITTGNNAYHVNAGWTAPRWGIQGGFRRIEERFAAPGDWGRIGIWWNPRAIEGAMASAHFNITDDWRLRASGEWYQGTEPAANFPGAFNDSDRVDRYVVGLEYRFAANWDLALGAEWVDWRLGAGGGRPAANPTERWYNIGFGWTLGPQARMSFLWQISEYNGQAAVFSPWQGAIAGLNNNQARGGLITTQLSVKF